jgi:lipoate---protein ligase
MRDGAMTPRFRVIDTGIREGRANIAFDQAMIERHQARSIPDSIRFLRFTPTALIGRHQVLSHEVNVTHCRDNGVGVARRITGGGAIYFDEGQLGWALVFHRSSLGLGSLEALTRGICEAAAAGLSGLGIDACYRPRNDIEVGGRKISGTGGFFDGDTLFYQGTVLVDMDPADMVAALRVPAHKLGKRGIDSAATRIVTLKALLGDDTPDLESIKAALLAGFAERLAIAPFAGKIGVDEEAAARRILDEEVGTDEFVAEIDDPAVGAGVYVGSHTGAGGTVTSYVRLEGRRQNRIREILLTGDFFVTPPRVVLDLEAALRGAAVGEVAATIEKFFGRAEVGLLSITPADFLAAIDAALGQAAAAGHSPVSQ